MDSLTLLVLTDLHYTTATDEDPLGRIALGRHSLEWVRRALREAWRLATPDAIVVLGDSINDENANSATADLESLASALHKPGVPVFVVRGNHDPPAGRMLRIFGDAEGPHEVKGYLLYTFNDAFADDNSATRPGEALRRFIDEAGGRPIITFQHNPVFPDVPETDYPYMLTNRAEVTAAYERAGVIASLSGHYHRGREPVKHNGVAYVMCAASMEPPFPFYIVRAQGREARIEKHALRLPEGAAAHDGHIHSHFGYCAEDVRPASAIERARMLGLSGITCVEHAGQIYLTREEFWGTAHIEDPGILRRARAEGRDRMAAFRREMAAYRSDFVRLGLEIEADRTGGLTLLPEDADGWDTLLGGIHWLPRDMPAATQKQREESYLRVMEQLVRGGVHTLAHPFRLFHRSNHPRPTRIYRAAAELLAAHNVAAEINFHTNEPDPAFFRICRDHGVRIVLGSDAHRMDEVGDLHPHLRLLKELGAC